jgi:hypothetical protein
MRNSLRTKIAKPTIFRCSSSHSSTNTHSVLSSHPSKYITDSSNFNPGTQQNYRGNYRDNRAGMRISRSMATIVTMYADPVENITTWKVILSVVHIVTLLSIPLYIVMMAVKQDAETEI